MTSTPTPPTNYSPVPSPKPAENQQNGSHSHSNHLRGATRSVTAAATSNAVVAITSVGSGNGSGSSMNGHLSRLALEFSHMMSTEYAEKKHSGMPRVIPYKQPHTEVADEVLRCLSKAGKNTAVIDDIFTSYGSSLCEVDDYIYMLKVFGNAGQFLLASKCFEFGDGEQNGRVARGNLTSTMIATLGKFGKIDLAKRLFEKSRLEGYGNSVHAYSTMINVFGQNGRFPDAVDLFRSMSNYDIVPNIITYNSLIDAGAKGEVDFDDVVKFYDEMLASGIAPDRFTYNSLLSVCAPKGMWEKAGDLLREMDHKGIVRDVYTYNTYLDTLCKGGKYDLARRVLEDMSSNKVWPNVLTYRIIMDGYAKANRWEDVLNLFQEMKLQPICIDKVSYNTMVGVYSKMGWFPAAIEMCNEMESSGIQTDVVTCNALLSGYGWNGMYDEARRLFEEMKSRNIYPNTLTYSTMIAMYTKGGMFQEAMEVNREFKMAGLETDVVFYSALINALCKRGLVESSIMLLAAMIEKGIKPNVVTFNSIIEAYGVHGSLLAGEYPIEQMSSMLIDDTFQNDSGNDRILKMLLQLASEKAGLERKERGRQDIFCILWLFQKMHEMQIKPTVVTFSGILNICSRCNSIEDASKLLDTLRLFDNQVYDVTHGLLMGYREHVWLQAETNNMMRIEMSTASAFYNALTDMLWHFGQRRGAEMVVIEGQRRQVWKSECSISCLDLHLMSCGAASAMVHAWFLKIYNSFLEGFQLPKTMNILTGWGQHSKVMGDGNLRKTIEELLNGMGSPFRFAKGNIGRLVSPGDLVASWLTHPMTLNMLLLHDVKNHSEAAGPSHA